MSVYTENLPDLTKGFCVLDLETTGRSPVSDHIVEIALVVRHDGVVRGWSCLVDSVDQVPPDATTIHGITTEMLKTDGLAPELAYRQLFRRTEFQELPVVGHNILRFDREFLAQPRVYQYLDGQTVTANEYTRALACAKMIDTGALYKGIALGIEPFQSEEHWVWANRVMEIRSTLRWNLAEAARNYGVDAGLAALHRAAADAQLCHDLLVAICREQGLEL